MGDRGVSHAGADAYRVGDLVLDLARHEITRAGAVLTLPGLSFDLFVALVRAAPALLTIDQVMDRVWGKVVVNPETVSQRVKLLRDALGDDPRQPRYIASVRGRGYRLIAPVRPIVPAHPNPFESDTAPQSQVSGSPAVAADRRPSRVMFAGGAAFVLAVTAIAVLNLDRLARAPTDDTQHAPGSFDRTIAVLPFDDLGASAQHDDLGTALSDAVLHRLGTVNGISIIARASSSAAQSPSASAESIGRKLGARFLLDGSVQRHGNHLRVTASLADTVAGRQLWSTRLDRPLEDFLVIQDELATRVVHSVAETIADRSPGKLAPRLTSIFEAQLSYLQGKAIAASERKDDLLVALEKFDEALRLDPDLVEAYAASAETYLSLSNVKGRMFGSSDTGLVEAADAAVQSALSRDPDSGPALIARAQIRALRRQLEDAETDFGKGLELASNDAHAHRAYAEFLYYGLDPFEHPDVPAEVAEQRERYARAIGMAEEARRLDPLSAQTLCARAAMELYLGRPDEAASILAEALQVAPGYYPALGRLAQIRWLEGRTAEAIRLAEQALAIEPGALWIRHYLIHFYTDLGELSAAEAVLRDGGRETGTASMVIRLRQGRVADAAATALAMDGPPPPWDRDIATFALRELARVKPRERTHIVRALTSQVRRGNAATSRSIHYGSRFAALALADLNLQMGNRESAERMAQEVITAIERDRKASQDPTRLLPIRASDRQLALALALIGDDDAALRALAAALRDRTMRHLWYEIEREPTFSQLRNRVEFAAIAADFEAWLTQERSALDGMRDRRLVPHRTRQLSAAPQ